MYEKADYQLIKKRFDIDRIQYLSRDAKQKKIVKEIYQQIT